MSSYLLVSISRLRSTDVNIFESDNGRILGGRPGGWGYMALFHLQGTWTHPGATERREDLVILAGTYPFYTLLCPGRKTR